MNRVFASCVHVDPEGIFAFYRVEGLVTANGTFESLPKPREQMFPNRGTIRILHSTLHVGWSHVGNIGVFDLAEEHNFQKFSNEPNAARYRAVKVTPCIHQVVPLNYSSDQPLEIVKRLKAGLDILGELTSRVKIYLLLNDGVTCGPFEVKLNDSQNRNYPLYVVDEHSLLTIKSAWRKPPNTFKLQLNQRPDSLFIGQNIPEPEFRLDFTPPEIALRRFLDTLHDRNQLDASFTKAKRQTLAQVLAEIEPDAETKARLDLLQKHLQIFERLEPDFTKFVQEILHHPAAANRLAEALAEVKTEAKQALQAEQTELAQVKTQLEAARQEARVLEQKKKVLTKDLARLETEATASLRQLDQTIREQFEHASKNAAATLATVAMLRPFLQASAPAHPPPTPAPAPAPAPLPPPAPPVAPLPPPVAEAQPPFTVDRAATEVPLLNNPLDAWRHLAANLKRIGMPPSVAQRWSADMLAAATTGQAISVRGSLASGVCSVVAASLVGNVSISVEIPVGCLKLLDFKELRRAALTGDSAVPWGVIVHGANRSCPDAYGGDLLDRVTARSCGILSRTMFPLVILSLREGPSALSPTAKFSELGPVFHTDAFAWRGHLGEAVQPAMLSPTFAGPTVPSLDHELDSVYSVVDQHPSAAHRANLAAVFPILAGYRALALPATAPTEDVAKQALQSLASSWVLPFLATRDNSDKARAALDQIATGDDLYAAHKRLLLPEGSRP